jgi:hypothetical protein
MAIQMFPRDVSFVPILIHICIIKHFRYFRPTDYSKRPNSTGIINIGINSTLASMTESITNLLQLDAYSVDRIRDDGLWWDVGRVDWAFAISWELQGVPDTRLVSDQDLTRALELLEVREWKGHVVAKCYLRRLDA